MNTRPPINPLHKAIAWATLICAPIWSLLYIAVLLLF